MIRVRAKTIDGQFWQPKTKRNRTVPISDALLAILSDYEPPGDSIWFFPSPTGKLWAPDNFSRDLRDLNVAKGLPWSSLDFRHTFGSQLAQKGESLYKIATLMGNSPDICRKHYAALIPENMHDTVEFTPAEREPDPPDDTRALLEETQTDKASHTSMASTAPFLSKAAQPEASGQRVVITTPLSAHPYCRNVCDNGDRYG
jgi:hypothetical protein